MILTMKKQTKAEKQPPRFVVMTKSPAGIISMVHQADVSFRRGQANEMSRMSARLQGYTGHKFAVISARKFQETQAEQWATFFPN
jgi:hypothetical protein